MIRSAYDKGRAAALARYKLGNLQQGAVGYNPMLGGQAATGAPPPTTASPPKPPAAPMAAGASKAQVLG
jgi:hypothetical protein